MAVQMEETTGAGIPRSPAPFFQEYSLDAPRSCGACRPDYRAYPGVWEPGGDPLVVRAIWEGARRRVD